MEAGSTTTDEEWDETDLAALELAIEQTLTERDKSRVEQVQAMLRERDRIDVGLFCVYHRQMMALHLKPWETPPCWTDDPDDVLVSVRLEADVNRKRSAALLLKRMLSLGISQYHPDPEAAVEAAEQVA